MKKHSILTAQNKRFFLFEKGGASSLYLVVLLLLVTIFAVFIVGGALPSVNSTDNVPPTPTTAAIIDLNTNNTTGITTSGSPNSTAACPNIVDPAYFYPPTFWPQLIGSNASPSSVGFIFNPASGPGTSADQNLLAQIQQADEKGMPIYAYVYTSYGSRSITAVEADIDMYKTLYNLSNIMFDEMATNATDLSYYQTLVNYVHSFSAGSKVILNPGTYPDASYLTLDATINVFEGPYSTFAGMTPPAFAQTTPAGKMSVVVYAAPATDLTQAITLAQKDNAGTIYITDNSNTGNPYNTLPAYWSTELSDVASNCAK